MRLVAASILLLGVVTSALAADVTVGAVYPEGDARQAIDTALDIVNGTHRPVPVLMGQGGGLDRLGSAKLVPAYADDEGDPVKAATVAERLVSKDGAVVLIGGTTNAAAAAISRVAEAHGIPFLALNGTLTNTDGLTWFFRLGRTPAQDARALFRLLANIASANNRPLATVALLGEDTDVGRDLANPLRAAGAAAGLTVVEATQPLSGAPDLVLWLGGSVPHAPEAAPLVLVAPVGTGALEDGTFRVTSYTDLPLPARPGTSAIAAAYQARAGKPLTVAAAREMTGIFLLADVINRAESTNPMALRTALMATDTPGSELPMLWDGIRFDDSGQNVLATPALQQVQRGSLETVAPDAIATAAPIWKQPRPN